MLYAHDNATQPRARDTVEERSVGLRSMQHVPTLLIRHLLRSGRTLRQGRCAGQIYRAADPLSNVSQQQERARTGYRVR